ncbi:MAG: class I SAM-dependent methyltransferase, partial [Oscillospiraceae bacterium]|nr:class I SAM-dependent methyltransferase [Oscillospiraceae bacterium]
YYEALDMTEKKIETLCGYAASRQKIVEIGCGQGKALLTASKYFSQCLGVEPSREECAAAEKNNVLVQCGYFNEQLNLSRDFSAFMCFQVFEHLSDIYEVLDYAFEVLETGGVGLINVPNGQELLRTGAYHQFITEHINYYTPFSLALAAVRAGFEIIRADAVKETMELDLYVRKPEKEKCLDSCKRTQRDEVNKFLEDSERITIWGAGAKAPVYSGLLDKPARVVHLMDMDPQKEGRYVSGISVPIEPVSDRPLRESDAVLIFASAYNDEIIEKLREDYGYRGKIVYFEGDTVRGSVQ